MKMFPVIETSYDYFCFSYIVFVSASGKKKKKEIS